MKPALSILAVGLLVLGCGISGGCAATSTASIESQFSHECAALVRLEGPTTEPACSGTRLTVYLRGQQIRHLNWTIETSTQFIRREYFFDHASPQLVIETVHAKLDENADLLAKPRLISNRQYRLDGNELTPRRQEFLDHAKFLMGDFRSHSKDFSPSDK